MDIYTPVDILYYLSTDVCIYIYARNDTHVVLARACAAPAAHAHTHARARCNGLWTCIGTCLYTHVHTHTFMHIGMHIQRSRA